MPDDGLGPHLARLRTAAGLSLREVEETPRQGRGNGCVVVSHSARDKERVGAIQKLILRKVTELPSHNPRRDRLHRRRGRLIHLEEKPTPGPAAQVAVGGELA